MKRLLACGLLAVSSVVGSASIAAAENPKKVVTDTQGVTWEIDLDSRYRYVNRYGVPQVDFYLSTTDDRKWHSATASCNPYDVRSEFYGWKFQDTRNYPRGTVAGNIARVACD